MIKNNKILYDMIKKIEIAKSPAMYLGKLSLVYLQIYLSGFEKAQNELGYNDFRSLSNFSFFVAEYFQDSPNPGWANVILRNTNDENEAFETFFELYHKYANSDYIIDLEKWITEGFKV